jgi:amino-acid N-acetyltransferase
METTATPVIVIQRAAIGDARSIKVLIDQYAGKRLMLPRPLQQILGSIRDFFVARVDGEFAGCVALHIDLADLAEIRSLAVEERFNGLGVGRQLIEAALEDGRALGISRVYALTYVVDYFKKFGFEIIPKSELPNKVWADCVNCPFFTNCNETAVIRDVE